MISKSRTRFLRVSDPSFQADVYSLAIVVFEVMAEEEAFQDLSIMQLQRNVGCGEMRPPTCDLSKRLVDLLAKCWAKDGAKRLTALEFKEEWKLSLP